MKNDLVVRMKMITAIIDRVSYFSNLALAFLVAHCKHGYFCRTRHPVSILVTDFTTPDKGSSHFYMAIKQPYKFARFFAPFYKLGHKTQEFVPQVLKQVVNLSCVRLEIKVKNVHGF